MDRGTQAYIAMLSHDHAEIRENAVQVLANVGPPAVRQLLHRVKNGNALTRHYAALTLSSMGSADTLPRKILSDTRLTPRHRAHVLEALRQVTYQDSEITLRFPLPEIHLYCQASLQDDEPAVYEGARLVLAELQQRTLLRPSARAEDAEAHELLRAAHSTVVQEPPETLLRASESIPKQESPLRRAGWLARLRRHF